MNPTTVFRHAFWKLYASRHPNTPKASRFRKGFGGGNPMYKKEYVSLYIKQWLGTETVGVYVKGLQGESYQNAGPRIEPYREKFEEEFDGLNFLDQENGTYCVTQLSCPGGTRNPNNWDQMTDWLECQLQKYDRILPGD